MRNKRKLSKRQRLFRRVIYCFISVVIIAVVFFEMTVKDRLELVIISDVKTLAQTSLNETVSRYIASNGDVCNSLVEINTDSTGVKYLSENTSNVNTIKSELSVVIKDNLCQDLLDEGIDVKLGNFTGLVIFSEVGPYIHFSIESIPNISCLLHSEFESAGINQTIHHIKLEVQVDIFIGNPLKIESICFKSDFDIAQTVIIGNTPATYGNITR